MTAKIYSACFRKHGMRVPRDLQKSSVYQLNFFRERNSGVVTEECEIEHSAEFGKRTACMSVVILRPYETAL